MQNVLPFGDDILLLLLLFIFCLHVAVTVAVAPSLLLLILFLLHHRTKIESFDKFILHFEIDKKDVETILKSRKCEHEKH